MTLLQYHQLVLDKISLVDPSLFRKELRKAFKHLTPKERQELKTWFRTNCVFPVAEQKEFSDLPRSPLP